MLGYPLHVSNHPLQPTPSPSLSTVGNFPSVLTTMPSRRIRHERMLRYFSPVNSANDMYANDMSTYLRLWIADEAKKADSLKAYTNRSPSTSKKRRQSSSSAFDFTEFVRVEQDKLKVQERMLSVEKAKLEIMRRGAIAANFVETL